MIISLLLLIMVGMVIYAISNQVSARSRDATRTPGDLRQQVVRFFRLALLFGALALLSEGVAGLIAQIVPRPGEIARNPATLARAMAFTVVGLPVLGGLVAWQRRVMATEPDETHSGGWRTYLTVTLGLSLLLAVAAIISVTNWALGASSAEGDALGRAISWSVVWLVHWRVARRSGDTSPHGDAPAHLLFGSAVGLVLAAAGIGRTITTSLSRSYEQAWLTKVVDDGFDSLLRAATMAVIGSTVWWWYWLRHTERHRRSCGRDAHVLLGGVLGGLIAAVVGAATLFYGLLDWFSGRHDGATAASHFAGSPPMVATTIVGLAVWWYHRGVVARQRDGTRNEVDRIYSYLGAAVGLVTTAIAVTIAVVALIEAMAQSSSLAGAEVAVDVLLALTLLVVGVPVWAAFWLGAQHFAAHTEERNSISRRVFLLLVLGVSAVVALISLVVALMQFFEDVTGATMSTDTWYGLRVPVGIVLSTGALAAYHATVFRADHRRIDDGDLPASSPSLEPTDSLPSPYPPSALSSAGSRLRDVLVVSVPGTHDGLAEALQKPLGISVQGWQLAAPDQDAPDTANTEHPSPLDVVDDVVDAVVRTAVAVPQATRIIVLTNAAGAYQLLALRASE